VIVAVYGATGRTGRLVSNRLSDLGVDLRLVGRDERGLRAFARNGRIAGRCFVAPLGDSRQLDVALSRSDLVINCAGPYAETCEPLLAAALRNRVHYMDMSAEGALVKSVYDRWDEPARAAGVFAAPAVGAMGALGEWATDVLVKRLGDRPTKICVTYVQSIEQLLAISPGTIESATSGQFMAPMDTRELRRIALPEPYGEGQAVRVGGVEESTISRKHPGCDVRVYLSVDPGGPFNAPFIRLAAERPVWMSVATGIQRILGRWPLGEVLRGCRAEGVGKGAALLVEVETACGDGQALAFRARDPYEASADIVQLIVGHLVVCDPLPSGAVFASDLINPGYALRWLHEQGKVAVHRQE